MAHLFSISTTQPQAYLDGQGQGEVSFVVTNTTAYPIKGRLAIKPLGSTDPSWLRLIGDTERNFASNTAEQITVTINLPADTPLGTYSFRLDVISVLNPDEDYTEGPAVAMEVQSSPVEQSAFPWWILVVVGVLITVGGVLAYVFWPRSTFEPEDLVGLSIAQAENILEQERLEAVISNELIRVCDPDSATPHQVVSANYINDSQVEVVVASWDPQELVGLTQDEATQCLDPHQWTLAVQDQPIILCDSLESLPNQILEVGDIDQTQVDVVVASWNPEELLGMHKDEAQACLAAHDLTLTAAEKPITLCTNGTHTPDHIVQIQDSSSTTVNVVVEATTSVQVPRVKDLPYQQAQRQLEECSLQWSINEVYPSFSASDIAIDPGTVVKQTHLGQTVNPNQVITLDVVASKTFHNPRRNNQFNTSLGIWLSNTNGNQYCKEHGGSKMISHTVGCGEDESSYVEFKNGKWLSKSSGSTNQCYDIFKSITCDVGIDPSRFQPGDIEHIKLENSLLNRIISE